MPSTDSDLARRRSAAAPAASPDSGDGVTAQAGPHPAASSQVCVPTNAALTVPGAAELVMIPVPTDRTMDANVVVLGEAGVREMLVDVIKGLSLEQRLRERVAQHIEGWIERAKAQNVGKLSLEKLFSVPKGGRKRADPKDHPFYFTFIDAFATLVPSLHSKNAKQFAASICRLAADAKMRRQFIDDVKAKNSSAESIVLHPLRYHVPAHRATEKGSPPLKRLPPPRIDWMEMTAEQVAECRRMAATCPSLAPVLLRYAESEFFPLAAPPASKAAAHPSPPERSGREDSTSAGNSVPTADVKQAVVNSDGLASESSAASPPKSIPSLSNDECGSGTLREACAPAQEASTKRKDRIQRKTVILLKRNAKSEAKKAALLKQVPARTRQAAEEAAIKAAADCFVQLRTTWDRKMKDWRSRKSELTEMESQNGQEELNGGVRALETKKGLVTTAEKAAKTAEETLGIAVLMSFETALEQFVEEARKTEGAAGRSEPTNRAKEGVGRLSSSPRSS